MTEYAGSGQDYHIPACSFRTVWVQGDLLQGQRMERERGTKTYCSQRAGLVYSMACVYAALSRTI